MNFRKDQPSFAGGRAVVGSILFTVALFMIGVDQLPKVREHGFDYIPPGQKESVGTMCVLGFGGSAALLIGALVAWRLWRIANRP